MQPGWRRLADRPAAWFAILLALAILLRCGTFGDPNLFVDEAFYFASGIEMHHGALPYVDIWDRKPFGSFALFYLIAALSHAPVAYQIAAALCAAGTAAVITIIARLWIGLRGALLGGASYLFMLPLLSGYGGQTPVFYNLLVAIAALLVLRARSELEAGHAPRSVAVAMVLAGLAITVKQTTACEGVFLGLYACWSLSKSGATQARLLRAMAFWATLGAGPMLVIAGGYWAGGHWSELWHAMVTSNLAKQPDWYSDWVRAQLLMIGIGPLLLLGGAGLTTLPPEGRRFMTGWLLAAMAGLVVVPNFYPHYALPLTLPLCIAAGAYFDRGAIGLSGAAVIALLSLYKVPPLDFEHTRRSRMAMEELAQAIRIHGGERGLLVYDGPPMLYPMTGQRFLTPLAFPPHLNHLPERDVSHLSTLGEVQRVLSRAPGAVVLAPEVRITPPNADTRTLVLDYAQVHCHPVALVEALEFERSDRIAVYGDCRP